MKTLILLLVATVALAQIPPMPPSTTPPTQADPIPVFEQGGAWGDLVLYSVSVCNPNQTSITVMGNSVWSYAQQHGLRPMTRSQLQLIATDTRKWSAMEIARTGALVLAGITTAIQASGAIGEDWKMRYKVIAPTIGAGLTVTELVLSRHEPEPLDLPTDYLPPRIDVQAKDCWVGTLIGRPITDATTNPD